MRKFLTSGLLGIAVISITLVNFNPALGKTRTVPTPPLSPRSFFSSVDSCKLESSAPKSPPFALGYTRDDVWAPTHGTLNVAVAYLSYNDATINPRAMNEMIDIQEPNAQKFWSATSYGQLHINFLDAHKAYKVAKNLLAYNLKDNGPGLNSVFADAMTASAADYDFSKVDEFAVVLPDSLPVRDIGPIYGDRITVGGATVTRGFDITFLNPSNHKIIDDGWLTHELGHTLGLTHPFAYNLRPAPYAWDVMQFDNTAAPNLFVWEKYILGWISDSQVDCLDNSFSGTANVYLDNNGAQSTAIKMLMYRISDSQAIIIESRHKSAVDPLTAAQEGVLVYKLDLTKGFGEGAITLVYKKPQINSAYKYGTELYGSLHEGESVVASGLKVGVLKSVSTGDYVSVSKVN